MRSYRIAVIPGDGVGPDVIAEGVKVLKCIQEVDGELEFSFEYFPWGAGYYLETGKMMPDEAPVLLKDFDAIYFGAVGLPEVPDWIPSQRLIFVLRKCFDQYVNLRPIKLLKGAPCPLKGERQIDMVFVRENVEGEYGEIGGRLYKGFPQEASIQVA